MSEIITEITNLSLNTNEKEQIPPTCVKRTDSGIALNDESTTSQMLLSEAILARHSSRLYLPREVPRALLERALSLATHAPSNTNTQAWRLFVVTGEALTRLKTSLLAAAGTGKQPNIPSLPAAFDSYHHALGHLFYGTGLGLARDDAEGRRAAVLRNFEFFGAPVAVLVCMSRELRGTEALSVGMYLQTFLLALTEMGVGSCVEISVAGYPDIVKREVGIPEDLVLLCGVAVGFEDAEARVNQIRADRDEVGRFTAWVQ
ncbi:oxidoreductase [Xylaria sp. FL0933]|nr:oxidoreductase [Xylaria sp. FL0933]